MTTPRQYYEQYFPTTGVYEWYTLHQRNNNSIQDADEMYLNEIALPAQKITREWAFGNFWTKKVVLSSAELRATLCDIASNRSANITSRCDVGPLIALAPTEIAEFRKRHTQPPIYQSELRFDIDATDEPYTPHRAICGCGTDKTKFCEYCSVLIGAVGQYIHNCVQKYIIPVTHLYWSATGGRGIHGWSRSTTWASLAETQRRELCKFIQAPQTRREFGDVLRLAESRLGDVPIPVVVDAPVTITKNHLLRAVFTVKDEKRINAPIESPQALTPTSSPWLQTLHQDSAWRTAMHVFENIWQA